MNCVDVIFEKLSPDTYDTLYAFVESGEGIAIEIKSGLKFMVNLETKNTQTFVLAKGSFQEKVEKSDIKVYYDGIHVAYGDLIMVQTVASEKCIAIQGIGEYSVSSAKDGETTTYTITYGEDETFTFAVQEEIVVMEEQGGCNGSILGLNGILLAVALAVVGKKHRARIEEQGTK